MNQEVYPAGLHNRPIEPNRATFSALACFYRELLTGNILPWWLRHSLDPECGGIYSCIGDDGVVLSHNKYVWSQTRALWTFSASYNRVQRNPDLLKVADDLFGFLRRFGRNDAGDWNFLVSRAGEVIQGPESIQTDAYALCGLVEYARASGLEEPLAMAYQTYARTLEKLRTPGSYRTAPYPMPAGTKAQRVSMQFSLAYHDLARFTGDARVLDQAMLLTDDILDNFRQPQLKALVDYLSLDNKLLPAPLGTLMGPGHGIESAWFQIESLRERGDRKRIGKALDVMRWSFEKGWDPEFGGLFLGIDIGGGKPLLDHSDAKIWWPFCEALCGALLAWEWSGEQWCLDWYRKTSQWAFDHFPDHEHGEWKQRLDRRGQPITEYVALPVKDPFHLPRAAIYALECAERILQKDNRNEQSEKAV